MKENFIKTSDKETACKLRELGFQEIKSNEENYFTFLNCSTLKFSENFDKSKLRYTNILCM